MYFSEREIASFWDALTPYWNRRPGVIRKPFSRPLVDQSEFLAILKQWAENVRKGRSVIDVAIVDSNALPGPEDTSLAACEAQISDRWKRDWYLYIADGVHLYQGAVWERAVELMVPAIRLQGGLPAGGMMLDLFFGHYKSTPTGIHLDSSDNLAFIVRGPKRMLFWEPERFTVKFSSPPRDPSHQRALIGRYDQYLDDAIVIDAEEGDVVYWPKEYWHIGVSAENWSGMVSLPMWWTTSPATLARSMVTRVLDLRGDPQLYACDVENMAAAATDVPSSLQSVMAQVKAQVNARLDLTAQVAWAKFVTSYGFTTPPAPLPVPDVAPGTKVRGKHPIVTVPLGRVTAVIGCGHQTITSSPKLAGVADHLRNGAQHTVGDLARLVAADEGEETRDLMKMVSELAAFRALEVA
jgi:hypothetical protein